MRRERDRELALARCSCPAKCLAQIVDVRQHLRQPRGGWRAEVTHIGTLEARGDRTCVACTHGGLLAGCRELFEREETRRLEQPAARRLAVDLDESCLAIQGPPGSGKTYTGARMILDVVRAGQRVGITASAHKAITNMIGAVLEAAEAAGESVGIVQKAEDGVEADAACVLRADENEEVADALRSGRCAIAAGTAWLP